MKSSNSRAIETITSSTTTNTSRFMRSMKSNHPGRLIALLTILIGLFVGVSAVMVRQVGAFRQSTSGSSESLPLNQDDQVFVGEVTLTATAGTATGTFTTLKEAFDAINLGTHQGAIVISINADTAETASAVLNSGAVAPAAYTSVLIQPVGGPRTVSGNIVGAIIKLNGADNVTIDGRIGGVGTGRDLSVINNQSTTQTAAIWLSSLGAGAGATNNTIRNLELACGATQNTGTLSTYGIIMNGLTISTTVNGEDNDNNSFVANRIIKARYGIVTRGLITNLNINPRVTDNIIGPAAFGTDEIGKAGIFMQADTGATISRNTVQFVGGDFANTNGGADRVGIAIGVQDWGSAPTTLAGANYTVTRNVIHDVIEERTFSALGVLLSAVNGTNPTNNVVANNFIYNVNANGTAGDVAAGIGIGGGNGDRVVFNSVRMAGDSDPNASAAVPSQTNVNMRIANTPTNLTVKNNSLYNDMFSSSAPALLSANIQVQSATFAFGTGGLNNNNYFFPPANTTARTGAIGTTSVATSFFQTLANWQAAITPPQDANSIQADPQYLSATDLHIALASPNVNAGATGTGIVNDIDFQTRDAMPDIGADEPNGATAPANDIAALSIVTPAPGAVLINGTTTTPQAGFYNAGSATQTGVMVQFTITGPGGYSYSNTQSIASIGSDEAVTVTFAPAPAFTTSGSYTTTATVLTPDSNTANDTVSAGFTVIDPLSGPYTVGAGGNFTSLTNPGGLFEAINLAGASGNITANIISDLTVETGAIPLNQLPGGFGLTIKPSGGARIISGTAPASTGLIILNGADNVTIDGSLSGGTDRSLTIINNQTGLSTVIWIRSQSAANGANSNTVKNCIINGMTVGTTTAQTTAGILAGSGVTLGNAAEAPNNNNTLDNNLIFRVQNSFYNQGNVGLDQNWTITNNEFGSSVEADKNRFRGMLMGNANNFVINGNFVHGVSNFTGTAGANTGIHIAFAVTNGFVVNNRISDIHNLSATGTGAFGMQLGATPTTNITIANNFIFDVQAVGSATVANNGHGITINGAATAGGYKIYHNSINMNTNQTSGTSAALNLTAAVVAAGALDVRNNIFANTQTAGATRRAVHSAAAASVFGTINYNDYFSTGSVGFIGGVDRPTLADWQTGTGQDANSQAVDPLFISPTDLHLQPTSMMINAGVTGTGITTDIDGQTRDALPDIGADEIVSAGGAGTLQFSSPTYSVGEAGPAATITVSRTGGSTGIVTVDYATVAGGNATGGAACGGTVDYVNTSGTATFPDTNTSQTFTIPICSDALNELNETVNLLLTNATGGATIGAQNTAVLTINDDDPIPSLSIDDVTGPEGNAGTTLFNFTVQLSAPSGQTVTVHYQTANGSATTADNDYVAIPDTVLTFVPGQTFAVAQGDPGNVHVTVNGDTTPEPNENFFVNLSTATNATIADNQGVGTIVNDDGTPPGTFSINDVRTQEGNAGTHLVTFTVSFVTLGPPPGFASVQYATGGGTAVAGASDPADYMSASGTLNFGTAEVTSTPEGGSTQTQTFTVTIIGDVNKEPNETFFVTLSNPNNGAIGDGLGSCVIFDEDRAYVADFDRDLKTDLSVFRPIGEFVDGIWYISQSTNGVTTFEPFGANGDKIVPGDYDADGVSDFAVFRPSTAIWYIRRSSDFAVVAVQWGQGTDLPVQGDYDGDDKTDIAVFRPSNGTWYVLRSSDSQLQAFQWGAAGDKVVPGDYDGDGKHDFAVFRPSSGTWFVQPNTDVTSRSIIWGTTGDIPVSGDFDGDGSADIALFRPSDGNWYISTSLNGSSIILHWGQGGDIPVVGDYDADGISDIAVWRPTTGDWYILNSNDPAPPPPSPDAVIPAFAHWGQVGDKPVPAAYVPEQ